MFRMFDIVKLLNYRGQVLNPEESYYFMGYRDDPFAGSEDYGRIQNVNNHRDEDTRWPVSQLQLKGDYDNGTPSPLAMTLEEIYNDPVTTVAPQRVPSRISAANVASPAYTLRGARVAAQDDWA